MFGCTHLHAQTIPSANITDWSAAGHTKYSEAHNAIINVMNVGATGAGVVADDSSIQKAIDSLAAASGGVVYLPQGTYKCSNRINLKSKVVLRGEGSHKTTLRFNLGGVNDCIKAAGSEGASTALTTSHNIGDTVLNIGTHSIVAGNWIRIHQSDSNFINDSWSSNYVGQIVLVDSVKSNKLYIHDPLRIYLSSTQSPYVRLITPVQLCGVEDLRIVRNDATSTQTSNIDYSSVVNSWIYGVESDSGNYGHFTFQKSSNIVVRGCYIRRAHNYGSGGKAYGVVFQYTTGNCLIEDNIFQRLRHAVLLQACPNGNVVSYNYSNDPYWTSYPPDGGGDIVLHGNYPYFNLFEGNIFNTMRIDNSHGINGLYNAFLRNRFYLYGMVMSGSADKQTFVGNEITGSGTTYPFAPLGNYTLTGTGHYEYNNNKNGVLYPSGSTGAFVNSLYLESAPDFWTNSGTWPTLGGTNTLNAGTIPAKYRFDNNSLKTVPLGMGTTLPVSMLSFTANLQNGKVELEWITAQEINNDFFILKRGDGQIMQVVSQIPGSGTTSTTSIYNFIDRNVKVTEPVYYQLIQVDFDGNRTSDGYVVLAPNGSNVDLNPNPFNDKLWVKPNERLRNGTVRMVDLNGRIVLEQVCEFPTYINTADMPNGIYQLCILNNSGQMLYSRRIIKN